MWDHTASLAGSLPPWLEPLRRLTDLPPWMVRPVARIGAWYALLLVAITVVKSATNALFLARADPARLPFLYVVVALCVLVLSSAIGRWLGHHPPAAVLAGAVLVSTGLFVVLVGAVALDVPHAPAALYVLGELYATALSVLFWARVADAFSPRNLRRALGPISAGGMAGTLVGGVLIGLVAHSIGVLFPVMVTVAVSAATFPLLRGLRSRSRRELEGRGRASLFPALGYLSSGRFPLLVALLVVLLAATGASVDFAFRIEAALGRTEDEMAVLFGLLNAAVGGSVVFVQTALTGRLLARLGLFAFAALVPTLLFGLAVLHGLGVAGFGALLVLKGVEMAGAFSLYNAAVTLLYNPMPTRLRSQMRTLIDGAIKKGGAALAGVLLGVWAWRSEAVPASWVVAGLAALTLLALVPLRRAYLVALDGRLGARRRARPGALVIDARDRATAQALLAALDDEDAERVLHALEALGEDFALYPERVVWLLGHPDERVRSEALRHVPARVDPRLTAHLLRVIHEDTGRRVRSEAIRALGRTAPDADLVARFFDDADPGARCAALEVALLRDPQGAARQHLDRWVTALRDEAPAARREVARLLGRLGEARYDEALSALLEDEDPGVRRLAIQAAGRERHLAHLGPLVRALGARETRLAAREALVGYGDAAVAELSRGLDDRDLSLGVRIHIPRVLAAIGTEDAARALLYSNPRDDAYLQQRIADRLAQIASDHPGLEVGRDRAYDAAVRRLRSYRAYDEAEREVASLVKDPAGAEPALKLLLRVLRGRREQNLRIALQLLGLFHGLDRMMGAFRALVGAGTASDAARQDALELLDTALAGDPLRGRLLPLLEAAPGDPAGWEPRRRLADLCRSSDPLVRATARRAARALGDLSIEDGLSFRAVGEGAEELEGDDMAEELVERLLFLENVDLFEGLGIDDLAAIAGICTEHELAPGARIYAAGEVGDCLYVIERGEVLLSREGERILELHPGESLGQVSFLDRGPRPVDAWVGGSEPALLLRIERGAFLDLLTDRPGLMHAFFGVLAARLRSLIDRDQNVR